MIDDPRVTWKDRLRFQDLLRWEQYPHDNPGGHAWGGWRGHIYHNLGRIGLGVTFHWERWPVFAADGAPLPGWGWEWGCYVRILSLCISIGYSDPRLE